MYITRIRLNHIRGFRPLDLQITDDHGRPRMCTALVGMNGTCKTTFLRCIAIGLCDRAQGNALLTEPIGRLVSENEPNATITIYLKPSKKSKITAKIQTRLKKTKIGDVISRKDDPQNILNSLFVVGYGAGRSTEGPEPVRPYQIVDSVYTLFQYSHTLLDTELILRRLRDFTGSAYYEKTISQIKLSLGLTKHDNISLLPGGGVAVSGPTIGKQISLEGWADGYRLTFNWILDLYAWAMRAKRFTKTGKITGVLLIDELEQHIHPSLQLKLLPELSRLLPELQIFCTTHSPLVALGADPNELVVLKRKGAVVVAEVMVPDFAAYSAEDMLVDARLFETAAYKPEHLREMERYQSLAKISRRKRSRKEAKELISLARSMRMAEKPPEKRSDLLEELLKLRDKYDL